jgi:hypothetical protein
MCQWVCPHYPLPIMLTPGVGDNDRLHSPSRIHFTCNLQRDSLLWPGPLPRQSITRCTMWERKPDYAYSLKTLADWCDRDAQNGRDGHVKGTWMCRRVYRASPGQTFYDAHAYRHQRRFGISKLWTPPLPVALSSKGRGRGT